MTAFKKIFHASFLFGLWSCISKFEKSTNTEQEAYLQINKNIHDVVSFIPHSGNGQLDNYLAQIINFNPVEQLFKDVQKKTGIKLKNRGEAHITVITPPEYNGALKNFLKIEEIDKIATEMRIQDTPFRPLCIGQGTLKSGTIDLKTFFLVVNSQGLFAIREEIAKRYLERGGDKKLFLPQNFFPHITIGFSHRDLHESDGVKKDKNSCLYKVNEL